MINRLHRAAGRLIHGTPIWAFEWDICCILDACRLDTFREFYPDAEGYWSVEASSKQWLHETFTDRDCSRVAYITANPFATSLDPDEFAYFHAEPVTETAYGVETVPPETLLNHAVSLWRRRGEYDIDQLVVHFMQPHVPFRSRPEWFSEYHGTDVWGSKVWRHVDDLGRHEWFTAYRDNLEWVLDDAVEPLTRLVDATVGVTADHGNAAGEWGVYGHPAGVAAPPVRRVPWHSIEAERRHDRFQRVALSPEQSLDRYRQLRALGYAAGGEVWCE